LADYGAHVEGGGFALVDEAAGGVAEDVHVGVADGVDGAPGDLVGGLPQAGVDRGHHYVEPGQHVVREVEGAVEPDLHFGAVEDADAAAHRSPDLLNLLALGAQPLDGQAPDDGEAEAVVGDGDILIPPGFGGADHVEDAFRAVAPGRVAVEVTLDVRQLDQVGEPVLLGGLQLP